MQAGIPHFLTQKCQFCHFHAVLGHFAQIASPPPVDIWETLASIRRFQTVSNVGIAVTSNPV